MGGMVSETVMQSHEKFTSTFYFSWRSKYERKTRREEKRIEIQKLNVKAEKLFSY